MAVTKIHSVKTTPDKTIDYVTDPDKTDDHCLVDCIACSVETAKYDFEFALSQSFQTGKRQSNKAYHLIQSFAPGETTPEQAHEIGMELADRLLGGKYCCIVATHVDKDHIHNHIVFCAADNIEHKKYNDCKRSYYQIRKLSDDLCREHNLSIVEDKGRTGKKYNQWRAEKDGTSWKSKIRTDIDHAIKRCTNYDDFLAYMRDELKYEFKGAALDDSEGKYLCFKPEGKERFVRCSVKNFGVGYTRDEIVKRLENTLKRREMYRRAFSPEVRAARMLNQQQGTEMIDTSAQRFQDSPGLKHWADKLNLKAAAHIYAESGGEKEMSSRIDDISEEYSKVYMELLELERSEEYTKYKDLSLYLQDYKKYRDIYAKCKNSKDPEKYRELHEAELFRYEGARNMLKNEGIPLKQDEIEHHLKKATEILAKRRALNDRKQELKTQMKELDKRMVSFGRFMGRVPAKEDVRNTDRNDVIREPQTPRKKQETSL